MNSNLIVAILLTTSLLVGLSYAQSSVQGGISNIIDSIVSFLRSLIASIFGQQSMNTTSTITTTATSTTTTSIHPTTSLSTTTPTSTSIHTSSTTSTSINTSSTTSTSTVSISTTIKYSPPCIKVGPLYVNETLICPPVKLRLVDIAMPDTFGVANAIVTIYTNDSVTYYNSSLYPSRNIIAEPYIFRISNGGVLGVFLYQTNWNQYSISRWANITINYTQPVNSG